MASNFTATNPIILSSGCALREMLAANSVTWKKGELGYLTSGTVTPVSGATGGKSVYCQFAEDQDTATSSSNVWVRVLKPETILEVYVTATNGTAAAIGVANMGVKYGIYSASNVCTLDTAQTAGDFEVIALSANYDAERNATANTPGKCKVAFRPEIATS